jgi:hypothetical protein
VALAARHPHDEAARGDQAVVGAQDGGAQPSDGTQAVDFTVVAHRAERIKALEGLG